MTAVLITWEGAIITTVNAATKRCSNASKASSMNGCSEIASVLFTNSIYLLYIASLLSRSGGGKTTCHIAEGGGFAAPATAHPCLPDIERTLGK